MQEKIGFLAVTSSVSDAFENASFRAQRSSFSLGSRVTGVFFSKIIIYSSGILRVGANIKYILPKFERKNIVIKHKRDKTVEKCLLKKIIIIF